MMRNWGPVFVPLVGVGRDVTVLVSLGTGVSSVEMNADVATGPSVIQKQVKGYIILLCFVVLFLGIDEIYYFLLIYCYFES